MALGPVKRKRRIRDESEDLKCSKVGIGRPDDTLGVFRKHFEETFAPLPQESLIQQLSTSEEAGSDDENSGTDWEGLSEPEGTVELVEDAKQPDETTFTTKVGRRSFMTSKVPKTINSSQSLRGNLVKSTDQSSDADGEATNLKHDLALQRLLKESHLLGSQSSLSHHGQGRHRAVDLRLQDLGSKSSVFTQKNMPMTQRKGMHVKATEREQTRRKDALENGIILEKAKSVKNKDAKRLRGIGAPSVGKFRGGMLKLSKKDVEEIQGPKKVMGKKGKRR